MVAVDLPSGIDADTGTVDGPAVRADVTVTFGALKPGLLIDPGAGYAGTVELIDIGLGPYLDGEPAALAAQHGDLRELLPRPGPESDKYRRGVVGLLAGSDRFAGAAVLSAGGAVHGGAGMVRVVTAPVPAAVVRQAWPEAVLTVHPEAGHWDLLANVGRVQAWVAGPGMGTDDDAAVRLTAILGTDLPVLVDADGLTILSQHDGLLPRAAPTLITPHAGELGRLLRTDPAQIEARPARARPPRRRTARRHRPAQRLHHGGGLARPPDRPGQPDRHALAGHRGLRRRAVRPGRRAAGPGPRAGPAGAAAAYLHGLSARLPAPPGRRDATAARRRLPDRRRQRPGPASLPAAFRSLWPERLDLGVMDRQALVDLGAITGNVTALCDLVRGSQVMAVVKADGYGHGMVPAARAALAGGASWLGTADLAEAVALRRAGLTVPVLCLMAVGDPAEAIAAGIDVTAGSAAFVTRVADAAQHAGVTARLHLKADTGLTRGGATRADWPGVVEAAVAAQARGAVRVVGLWSHFACADLPGHPSIAAQLTTFADAVAEAEKAGVTPEVRHIANTAAAITVPESRLDLVRFGGAVYGLSTLPGGAPSWLRPAMTLSARLALVKRVPPGSGVSYGHRYVTERETTLGLVPLGYADGVPRAAAGQHLVSARGRRWPIAGTVCMDQFVVDFGDEPVAAGEPVVLFGPGDEGEATAQEWGERLGTISYDIATGIGARVPRHYPGGF